MKPKFCIYTKITRIFLIIGGLNWGLVALGIILGKNLNLFNLIFGKIPLVEIIVYLLITVSAIVEIFGCSCEICCPIISQNSKKK